MKKIILTVAFTLAFIGLSNKANAQWVTTNANGTGTNAGTFLAMATNGTKIFAGSNYNGIFRSEDQGVTWTALTNGLTGFANFKVQALTISGNNIFVGTSAGIFLSSDTGNTWTAINTGLTSTNVYAIAVSGSKIFAGCGQGTVNLFSSTDNGSTWTADATGLGNPYYVYAFAVSGSMIYAGTSNGVCVSTDNGSTWTPTSLTNTTNAMVISGSNIFAGTDLQGVYLSTDNGGTWNAVNTGLIGTSVKTLILNGTSIIAGTHGGVSVSNNNGANWTADTTGFFPIPFGYPLQVNALALSGSVIYAGLNTIGVWKKSIATGINNISVKNNLSVYPNPSNGSFTIETNTTTKQTMQVYDVNGKMVLSQTLNGKTTIDASTLNEGVYNISIISNEGVVNKRVVIVK